MNAPNPAVAAAIARRSTQTSAETDTLEAIRAKAREAKEMELHIEELEEQLKQTKKRLHQICFVELVDMLVAAKVNGIDVAAQGNMQAFVAKLKPYYSAAIPADMPEEKRMAAFRMLEETGNGDLIKTIVTVDFPREARADVADFISQLPKTVKHEVKASVHKATLTKWLRETVEAGQMPDLEKINGVVGQTVELKNVKEK
jgi:hypothetical protein